MTDCASCGRCCENIDTSWDMAGLKALAEKWEAQEEDEYGTRAKMLHNYAFIRDNWVDSPTPKASWAKARWECNAFDPQTRLCTAYENRPGICSGYPYYGKEPPTEKYVNGKSFDPACSFNADVRTMLPIVEVR